MRVWRNLILLFCLGLSVSQATGQARVIGAQTSVTAQGGAVLLQIALDQPAPYRVFTLDNPRRLIVDVKSSDMTGFIPGTMDGRLGLSDPRYGMFTRDWARIVFDLDRAFAVGTIEYAFVSNILNIGLDHTSDANFAALAGAPPGVEWQVHSALTVEGPADLPVIAIDAGHGGVDPGAIRGYVLEKDLTLVYAQELRAALLATGRYQVAMVRQDDSFISLRDRVRLARSAGADVMLSLHANTVERGNARGASVYNLSEEASDEETADIVAFENRADLLAGVDLDGEEDLIAQVLVDMAQRETNLLSEQFGAILADSIKLALDDGVRSRHRWAGFRVLKAPDIPSVLVELGFMSSPRDLEDLQSQDWRAGVNAQIIAALDAWIIQRAETRAQLRN